MTDGKGSVMHAMKNDSIGFSGFGEAYFSEVNFDEIKGWKRHKNMVCNIVVPSGKVLFVMKDNRTLITTTTDIILSKENYQRLTIPPGIWFGFKGLSALETNLILNIASIKHDLYEQETLNLSNFDYNWKWRV